MAVKKIERLLKRALIHDGGMAYALYEYELADHLDDLRASMAHDKDDYIFAVTENRGDVAMVLIEKSGQVYINEEASERLKTLWPAAYESNMKLFIPLFAQQLHEGQIPINGVKIEGDGRLHNQPDSATHGRAAAYNQRVDKPE